VKVFDKKEGISKEVNQNNTYYLILGPNGYHSARNGCYDGSHRVPLNFNEERRIAY
jgi:hypothetical protein